MIYYDRIITIRSASIIPNSKIIYQVPSTEGFHEPETLFEDGYICPDISYPLKEEMGVEDYKKVLSISSAS